MSNTLVDAELLQSLLLATPAQREEVRKLLRGETTAPVVDERPLLYTVTEAAQRLNVSRSTCWRIIRAGRLTKVEIYPGSLRLRRADVEALAGGVS